MSARIIVVYFLTSLLLGAGVSIFVHFERFHIDQRLQLSVGLAFVLFLIIISGKLIHYQQSFYQTKNNLDEAQQPSAFSEGGVISMDVPDKRMDGLQEMVIDYIIKPFEPLLFISTVKKHLVFLEQVRGGN
jgi:hypothetical protein